jgi:hypothetical protein
MKNESDGLAVKKTMSIEKKRRDNVEWKWWFCKLYDLLI